MSILKKTAALLSSVKLSIALFLLLASASFAGTVFTQERANALIYGTWWFKLLLGALVANTLACLLKKPFNGSTWPSWMMHAALPVIMAGALAGSILGKSGMMMLPGGGSADRLENGTALPFTVRLERFELKTHPVRVSNSLEVTAATKSVFGFEGPAVINTTAGEVRILEVIPDFVMGEGMKPSSRSDNWNNPAVRVGFRGSEAWLFARYPEFHAAGEWEGADIRYVCEITGGGVDDYISSIIVLENGTEKARADVRVNAPFNYKGWGIYQYSYDGETPGSSGLYLKYDPGVPFVYFGFILLCAGMLAQAFKKIRSDPEGK